MTGARVDLRISERETRELLDASGIMLSEAGVALRYQRTEGWAAGLRLAAISMAGQPDPERFVAEFLQQRPPGGGADESWDCRGVVPGAARR